MFPSVISFRDSGIVFGRDAKNHISTYPKQTVYEIKRLIGHSFTDQCVQEDIRNWPFEVAPNKDNRPVIKVRYNNEDHYMSPEQVSGFIILKLVEEAQRVAGTKITDIVVTVPAYFNDSQRRATADAAQAAGVNVLGILNEPTAAAIAYGVKNSGMDKTVLVYDLGGGTFDVTILEIKGNEYTVVASDGDTHLGGVDLDKIVEKMIRDIFDSEDHSDIDWNSERTQAILRGKAEDVKIQLSSSESAEFSLFDVDCEIYRNQFERNANSFFAKTMEIVNKILEAAHKTYDSIDDVVLVGGSSRVPYVKTMLAKKFGEDKISARINPDEAVSIGALMQAIQLYRQKTTNIDTSFTLDPVPTAPTPENGVVDIGQTGVMGGDILDIVDVVPLSLGLKNAQGVMSVLIPRFSPFGKCFTRTFVTNRDYAERMKIHVYQGERYMAKDNLEIGSLVFTGIPPMKRGMACVDVTFSTDKNGILTVSAVVCKVNPDGEIETDSEGNHVTLPDTKLSTTFSNRSTNLNEEEVISMMKKVKEMKEYDDMMRRCAELKNTIIERSYDLEEIIMEHGASIDPDSMEQVNSLLKTVRSLSKNYEVREAELQSYLSLEEQWIESLRNLCTVCFKQPMMREQSNGQIVERENTSDQSS